MDYNHHLVAKKFKFELRIDKGDMEGDENVDGDTDTEDSMRLEEHTDQVLLEVDETDDELDEEVDEWLEADNQSIMNEDDDNDIKNDDNIIEDNNR